MYPVQQAVADGKPFVNLFSATNEAYPIIPGCDELLPLHT